MLAILNGRIKNVDSTWNWLEQVNLLVPPEIKVIKRLGIAPVITTVVNGEETAPILPGLINCGAVSLYLNDEKIGEQLMVDYILSDRMSMNGFMRKVNRKVFSGDKLVITPTSPGIFLNPYSIYIKVLIEH